MGNAPHDFVNYLLKTERDIPKKPGYLYAKTVCVVQSSGTGKSRLLTEVCVHSHLSFGCCHITDSFVSHQVGKLFFTLPICLRGPQDPGHPPSDKAVFEYFEDLVHDNDMSTTAHSGIACFLAASHSTMLSSLRRYKKEQGCNGFALLNWWHDRMERREHRAFRDEFFAQVVAQAREVGIQCLFLPVIDSFVQMNTATSKGDSPRRDVNKGIDAAAEIKLLNSAKYFYNEHIKDATTQLMNFIDTLGCGIPRLCVTYFDEADELGSLFWILLRLIHFQDRSLKMWYTFMATKSSIKHFHPAPQNSTYEISTGYQFLTYQQHVPYDFPKNYCIFCHPILLSASITTWQPLPKLSHVSPWVRCGLLGIFVITDDPCT